MNHKENMNRGRTPKARKTATLLVAIVLLLGVAVGTTVAYLITNTGPVVNKFEYAKTNVTVTEEFTGTTKKDVQVKNEGNIPVYVRATYVVNWVDAYGNIVASVPAGYDITDQKENPDGKWIKGADGYFYYPTPVQPGKSTDGSLLTCAVQYPADNPEYTLNVEILATAIQSEPTAAVEDAWTGIKVGTDGKLIVPSATTN